MSCEDPGNRESTDTQHAASGASSAHAGGKDCSEVLDRVFFFLDNELDQADCSQIQQHLDECGPCLAKYDLERTVKHLVARSCSEKAPDTLRTRVLLSIQQIQVRIEEPRTGR